MHPIFTSKDEDESKVEDLTPPNHKPPVDTSFIKAEIENLSAAQIRSAIRLILASGTNLCKIPQEFTDRLNFWKEGSSSSATRAQHIRDDMNFFYDYFKADPINLDMASLKNNGAFATNMISHSSGNSGITSHDMYLFCEYMSLLSQKPKDIQESFLLSFPPQTAAEIACLGGTGARITDLTNKLKVSEEDRPLLETHEVLMLQIADKLKNYVKEGNQIHILPYLNYAFGLESKEEVEKRDRTFIVPQFEIPGTILWQEIQNYAAAFKKKLSGNQEALETIAKEVENKKRSFETSYNMADLLYSKNASTAFADENNDTPFSEMIDFDPQQNEGEDEKYVWSIEKITPKFLKTYWGKLHAEDLTKSENPQENFQTAAELFGKKAPDKIAQLLNSQNPIDLQNGVEAFWILGERFANGSPAQFVKTINLINEIEPEFLKKKVVPKLSPNYEYKIERISEYYKTHSTNKFVKSWLKDKAAVSFADLIDIGAPYEDLALALDATNVNSDLKINNLGYKKFSLRPDSVQILEKLASVMEKPADLGSDNKAKISLDSMKKLVDLAAQHNNTELATCLLTRFDVDDRIFSDPSALIAAQQNKNPELVKLFLEHGAQKYIDARQNGSSAVHIAAEMGDQALLKNLAELGANLNLTNKKGQTAAHIAAENGRVSILKTLKEYGANLDARDNACRRPLHLAIKHDCIGATKFLLENDSRLNPTQAPDSLYSAVTDRRKTADYILSSAAEPDLLKLAVMLKRSEHFEALFEALEAKGLTVSLAKIDELTAIAARGNDAKILSKLLRQGGEVPAQFDPVSTIEEHSFIPRKSFSQEVIADTKTSRLFASLVRFLDVLPNRSRYERSKHETFKPNAQKELKALEKDIMIALIKAYDFNWKEVKKDFGFSAPESIIFNQESADKLGKLKKLVKSNIVYEYSKTCFKRSDATIDRDKILGIFGSRNSIQNALSNSELTNPSELGIENADPGSIIKVDVTGTKNLVASNANHRS
jgi:hypothetical protein